MSSKEIELDVAVQTVNDRILVPFRAMTEAFDYHVSWYETTQTAHVFGWGVDLFEEAEKSTHPK